MKKKLLVSLPTITFLAGCYLNSPIEPTVLRDITNYSGSYSAKNKDFVEHEGIAQLFDASLQSKFLSEQSESWVQFEAHFPEVLKEYSLTSAQDVLWDQSALQHHAVLEHFPRRFGRQLGLPCVVNDLCVEARPTRP